MKRIFWFIIGIITGIVATVGGVIGGGYYFLNTSKVGDILDMSGMEVQIGSDSMREMTVLELVGDIGETFSNPDTTLNDIRERYGLTELITDDLFGIDMTQLLDISLGRLEVDGPVALFDSVTFKTLQTLGFELVGFEFLLVYDNLPIMEAINQVTTLPIHVLLSSGSSESNAILESLMCAEDDEGEYVKWTREVLGETVSSIVKLSSFDVNANDQLRYKNVNGTFRFDRSLTSSDDFYLCVDGEYISKTDAIDLYNELSTTQRYFASTLTDPAFDKVMSSIKVSTFITEASASGSPLLQYLLEVDPKVSEIGSVFNNVAVVDVMGATADGGVLSSLLSTEVVLDEYYVDVDGEKTLSSGAFGADYDGGIYYLEGEEYYPYYVVNAEGKFQSSFGYAKDGNKLADYTGKFYKATRISGLQDKFNNLTVIDAFGGLDKINSQNTLQGLAFAEYTAGCGYEGDVFYAKVANPDFDPDADPVPPSFIYEVCESTYAGTRYYPVTVNDVSDRVADMRIQDFMNEPNHNTNYVVWEMYMENPKVFEMEDTIAQVISSTALADFTKIKTSNTSKILKSLALIPIDLDDYDEFYNYKKEVIATQSTVHSTDYEGDWFININENVAGADPEYRKIFITGASYYEPMYFNASYYSGEFYYGAVNQDINDHTETIRMQEIIDDPGDSGNKILKKLFDENPVVTGDGLAQVFETVLDDLVFTDVVDLGVSTNGMLNAIAYSPVSGMTVADVPAGSKGEYYVSVGGGYVKLDTVAGASAASTDPVYQPTKISEIESRVNAICVGDVFELNTEKGIGVIIPANTPLNDLPGVVEDGIDPETLTIEMLFDLANYTDQEIDELFEGVNGTAKTIALSTSVKTLIDAYIDSLPGA